MNHTRRMTSILRNEYHGQDIDPGSFAEDPILQFERWMEEAIAHNVKEPNAVHLATVDADGRPSGRIVLLRDFSEKGFSFFTNYGSRKGEDLLRNNNASMTFFWSELFRQVRIGGKVSRLPAAESDAYFRSRPRESQINAVASQQSRVLENRDMLERRAAELDEQFRDRPVPRPDDWGGYCLLPEYVEFWQGREHRLHDRLQYIRTAPEGGWAIMLLYP